MAEIRAPYYFQIVDFIGNYAEVSKGQKPLRETSAGSLEIWSPITLQSEWPTSAHDNKTVWYKTTSPEKQWHAVPGQILWPRFREATKHEDLWWGMKVSKSEWPVGIIRRGKQIRVLIIKQYPDILSLIRTVLRHIPASILGESFTLMGTRYLDFGTFDQAGTLLNLLSQLQYEYTSAQRTKKKSSREQALEEMARIEIILERKRKKAPVQLKQELESARKFPGRISISLARAQMRAAEWELEDAEIVLAILDYAVEFLKDLRKIQSGMKSGLARLLGLRARILHHRDEIGIFKPMDPHEFEKICQQCTSTYQYLVKCGPVEPFYSVIHDPSVARLAGLSDLVGEIDGEAKLYRALKEAISHLEQLVKGQFPQPGEITRIKRRAREKTAALR